MSNQVPLLQVFLSSVSKMLAHVGLDRQLLVDTETYRLYVHDGVTKGGHALAKVSDPTEEIRTIPFKGPDPKEGETWVMGEWPSDTDAEVKVAAYVAGVAGVSNDEVVKVINENQRSEQQIKDIINPPIPLPEFEILSTVTSERLAKIAKFINLTGGSVIDKVTFKGEGVTILNHGVDEEWVSFGFDYTKSPIGSSTRIIFASSLTLNMSQPLVTGFFDFSGKEGEQRFAVGNDEKFINIPMNSNTLPVHFETNGLELKVYYNGVLFDTVSSVKKFDVIFLYNQAPDCEITIVSNPLSEHKFIGDSEFIPDSDPQLLLPAFGLKNIIGTATESLYGLNNHSLSFLTAAVTPKHPTTKFETSAKSLTADFHLESTLSVGFIDIPLIGVYIGDDIGFSVSTGSTREYAEIGLFILNGNMYVAKGGEDDYELIETGYVTKYFYIGVEYKKTHIFYKDMDEKWVRKTYGTKDRTRYFFGGGVGNCSFSTDREDVANQLNIAFQFEDDLKLVALEDSFSLSYEGGVVRTLKPPHLLDGEVEISWDDGTDYALVSGRRLYQREIYTNGLFRSGTAGVNKVTIDRQHAGRYRIIYQNYDVENSKLIGGRHEHMFTLSKEILDETQIPILYDYIDDTYLLLSVFSGNTADGQKMIISLKSPKGKAVHEKYRVTALDRVGGFKPSEYS